MDLSNDSYSRTRSGLVRRKEFTGPSDDSCSRTRSGLIRRKSFTESSDASCSRTRSGLVRRKGGSPSVKALIMDEQVRKGLPEADGHLIEETPSRTRSGLVRQRPTVKALLKDEPVIKGLADGWLKEDKPLGTQGGLVRGVHAAKALTKVKSVTKEQHDGWLRHDKPLDEAQSGITQETKAAKTLGKDESVTKGLPDGWWKEYRPRKPGSSQQNDVYYTDPVSGYEFRSLKDVHRYLQTGDIRYCAVKPKKGTKGILYDVYVTENQPHTSSSPQKTRPGTADKAIQCEILTSEGIMLPWEEHFIPRRGKNTEQTMSPTSESMKAMEKCDHRLETLQQNGSQSFAAQRAPRQTESIKRQGQNVEVKSKKRRGEAGPAVSPTLVSRRLAAMDAQSEAIVEPGDEPVSINVVNQLQRVEVNNNDQPVTNQSSTMNKIHGNDERTFNQLRSSQEVTVKTMQTMQENTTNHLQLSQVDAVTMQENTINHLQLSQVDAVNSVQMSQENTDHQLWSNLPDTDIRMQAMHGYASDQPSQETMNHKQKNMENTFNQLDSDLEDTLDHIELIQENTAPVLQSSLEDTLLPKQTMLQYTTVRQEDTMKHKQMNRENIANQLQASLADTIVTQVFINDHSQTESADSMNQIQMIQNNMNNLSQPNQANSLNQIDINLENSTNHLRSIYAENPLVQTGFSWTPELNGGGGAHVTDFWKSVENQDSSVPMQIDGVPVASFPTNVQFQSTSATAAAEPTMQATVPATASDQSGLVIPSLFGDSWSDPCIEFAFKTLTGDIPILDDTAAVTDYFPQQQDLNKSITPNSSASSLDKSKTRTQVDINLPLPRPSDELSNGSRFPPQ